MTENNQNTQKTNKIAELMDSYQFLVGSNSGIGIVCKTVFKKYTDMDFDEYIKLKVKPNLQHLIPIEEFLKICYALTNEIVKESEKIQKELETLLNTKPAEEPKKEPEIILG